MGTVVSGRRQACPAQPSSSITEPLHGAPLPTWCSQATALREMGKPLSVSPRLPRLVSNHVISSDQHCRLALPLKSCLSAFHLAPTQTPAQTTSPTILIRACPGPYTTVRCYSTCQGISYPGDAMDNTRNVCAASSLALNSSVCTQCFLSGVRTLTGPISSPHLTSPRFLHFHFSYETNI